LLKAISPKVWAFDVEWVPDPVSGRLVYNLGAEVSDDDVLEEMWKKGGGTTEEPHPYLKTVLCRVVSIAVVTREILENGRIDLKLRSWPNPEEPEMGEGALIQRFLHGIGRAKPQLVGFNSIQADLIILTQRGVVNGLHLPGFGQRPDKPWFGPDYFGKGSNWNVDLKDALSNWGKASTSLHEVASSCGIPGKIDVDGSNVVDLWREGNVRKIVQYNECDALTTYLLWLRTAQFCGLLTPEQYQKEESQLEELLGERACLVGQEHLSTYLEKWREMRKFAAKNRPSNPGK
jgi:predicted PolB exonuclease-like 3'-5' exonuclease